MLILALHCFLAVQAQELPSATKPYFTEYSFENLDEFPDYALLFPKLAVLANADFAKRRIVRNDEIFHLYPEEPVAFEAFRKRDLDSALTSRLRFLLRTNQFLPDSDSLIDAQIFYLGYSPAVKDSVWRELATAFFIVGGYQNPLEKLARFNLDSIVARRLVLKQKASSDAPRRVALDDFLRHLYSWNRRLSKTHGADFLDPIVLHKIQTAALSEKIVTSADDLSESMEITLRVKRLDAASAAIVKVSVIYYYENDREEELSCENDQLPSPKKK